MQHGLAANFWKVDRRTMAFGSATFPLKLKMAFL